MTDPAVWHALHRLTDYPVLAALAREGTEAIERQGLPVHLRGWTAPDRLASLSVSERVFMRSLGIAYNRCRVDCHVADAAA